MNFLAHLHLSYPNQSEMAGNFIGDYVKGRKYKDYPEIISRGIQLHRRIDAFTDTHPVQKKCRVLFSKDYGLYAGIITDMLFDHLLAQHWKDYSLLTLEEFSSFAYTTLDKHYDDLPERVQGFLPKMKASNRLVSYATLSGLEEALLLMTQYTSLPDHTQAAISIIENNYTFLNEQFKIFYQELISYVAKVRDSI